VLKFAYVLKNQPYEIAFTTFYTPLVDLGAEPDAAFGGSNRACFGGPIRRFFAHRENSFNRQLGWDGQTLEFSRA